MERLRRAPGTATPIRRRTRLTAAGLAVLALAAAGCNADEPVAPTVEPLRQIDIPEDFTFAMSRGIELQVVADAALAYFAPLSVQVSLPTGGTLYEGPVVAGTPKRIEVLAPLADGELVVKLTGRSKHIEERVAVRGASAQVNLQ